MIGVRSWTSDNLAPIRGQLQDVITLAFSLLIESLPFIVLGITLSIIAAGTVIRVVDLGKNTVVGEFPGFGFIW